MPFLIGYSFLVFIAITCGIAAYKLYSEANIVSFTFWVLVFSLILFYLHHALLKHNLKKIMISEGQIIFVNWYGKESLYDLGQIVKLWHVKSTYNERYYLIMDDNKEFAVNPFVEVIKSLLNEQNAPRLKSKFRR